MRTRHLVRAAVLGLALLATASAAFAQELLNVSYDPTRELWRDINAQLHRRRTRRRRGRR